jgi:hypothetical protein
MGWLVIGAGICGSRLFALTENEDLKQAQREGANETMLSPRHCGASEPRACLPCLPARRPGPGRSSGTGRVGSRPGRWGAGPGEVDLVT